MKQFFGFLSTYQTELTVLNSILLTLATLFLVFVTILLVRENKRLRKFHTEPKISLTLRLDKNYFPLAFIEIRNTGFSTATKISFIHTVMSGGGFADALWQEFVRDSALKTGLTHLDAGDARRSGFTLMNKDTQQKIKCGYKVDAYYTDQHGQIHMSSTDIRVSELEGEYSFGKPTLEKISLSLAGIHKSLNNISSGRRRVKIDAHSPADPQKIRNTREKDGRETLNHDRPKKSDE